MKVFVYGTLKRGYGNNRLLESSKFLNEATVEHFKLVGRGVPGAIPSRGSKILGEVWEIPEDDNTLARLDGLESNTVGYNRIMVRTDDRQIVSMYMGNPAYWGEEDQDCPVKDGAYVWSRA